jgi:hypothetical protein
MRLRAASLLMTSSPDRYGDQSERSASNSPLPIGASVALGVLVLGAGGLYAVKLRRG